MSDIDADDEIFDQLEAELEQDGTFNYYREQRINQLETSIRRQDILQTKFKYYATEGELLDSFENMKNKNYVIVFINELFSTCQFLLTTLRETILNSAGDYYVCVINAVNSPFLVSKLSIKVLPTMVVYANNKEIGKHVGLEGLLNDHQKISSISSLKLERLFNGYFPPKNDSDDEEDN